MSTREQRLIKLDAPIAAGVNSIVRAEFTPNERFAGNHGADLTGHTPRSIRQAADTTLTVRDGPYGKPQPIPRERWQLRGNTVTLTGGFEPGRTYELAYRATNLPVAGVGLAAFRDTASWLKYQTDALAPARYAYAWGVVAVGPLSPDVSLLRLQHRREGPAGIRRRDGAHRRRGATQPQRAGRNAERAGDVPRDGVPVLGRRAARSHQRQDRRARSTTSARVRISRRSSTRTPRSSTGAAAGRPRSSTARLDGKSDLTLPDNVRAYFLTGAQHVAGEVSAARDERSATARTRSSTAWTLRALLTAMDRWVRQGAAPPASQYPRLAMARSCVSIRSRSLRFRACSRREIIPARREGTTPLPYLVSAVDEDGNERAGIRTAEQAVPVATYTGWNFRSRCHRGQPISWCRSWARASRLPRPTRAGKPEMLDGLSLHDTRQRIATSHLRGSIPRSSSRTATSWPTTSRR